MGKFNFTKTIILGTIIAAIIIGAGITTVSAQNVKLDADTVVDGDLEVKGKLTTSSELPTEKGPELERKVVFYRDSTSEQLKIKVYDKDLNLIKEETVGGTTSEVKDTVISGNTLIITTENIAGIFLRHYDLTTGNFIKEEQILDSNFIKQIDVAAQPPTTASPVKTLPDNNDSECETSMIDGWCPDATKLSFTIPDDIVTIGSVVTYSLGNPFSGSCNSVSVFPNQFKIDCRFAPTDGTQLNYRVDNP